MDKIKLNRTSEANQEIGEKTVIKVSILIEGFDFIDDSLRELCGLRFAADVFGQVLAFSVDVEDRFLDELCEARESAVHEQVGGCEDEVRGVGLILAGEAESGPPGSA